MRETRPVFLQDDASPQEIRAELQRCADEIRRHSCGEQAARLDHVIALMDRKPAKLRGIVASLAHPQMWATREHALLLAAWITEAAEIIEAALDDCEITGSTELAARGRLWLEKVGTGDPSP